MAVSKSRFEVVLEIEGRGVYPVMAYGADFSLNAIPTATCSVNVGRRMTDGRVSPADASIVDIQRKDVAKVYFHARGDYSPGLAWPDETILIFEGRVEGFGQRSGGQELELVVFLRHWLAYLDSASAVSSLLHPGSPVDLIFDAVLPTAETTIGGLPNTMGVSAAAAHLINNWETAGQDLWAEGLKPLFWHLMNNTTQAVVSDNLLQCVPELARPNNNEKILAAIRRIAGVSTIQPGCSSSSPAYAPKLTMLSADALPAEAVRAVGLAIGSELSSSFGEQTLWGKLLQYASQFLFAVVPQVSQTLVVPFMPAARDVYCKAITVEDHEFKQLTMQLARPLRAVAVYNTAGSSTGLTGAGRPVIGGCFAPDTDDPSGIVWTIPPPSWLAQLAVGRWSPTKTTDFKNGRVNSAVTPRPITKQLQAIAEAAAGGGAAAAGVVRASEELMNGYAHAVFATERLRGRSGQVADKLRFDICPGSLVEIQSLGDRFIQRSNLADSLYGRVIGASIGINAEKTAAGTSFQIEFLRTAAENASDDYSVAKHPLYADAFRGGPLVDALQFGDCEEVA